MEEMTREKAERLLAERKQKARRRLLEVLWLVPLSGGFSLVGVAIGSAWWMRVVLALLLCLNGWTVCDMWNIYRNSVQAAESEFLETVMPFDFERQHEEWRQSALRREA